MVDTTTKSRKHIRNTWAVPLSVPSDVDSARFSFRALDIWFPSAQYPDPVHVVVGYDEADKEVHLITAYRPDLEHFEEDYKTRRT